MSEINDLFKVIQINSYLLPSCSVHFCSFICNIIAVFLTCAVPTSAPLNVAVYSDHVSNAIRVNWTLSVCIVLHYILLLGSLLIASCISSK